jgi:4-aminobutyrate aminotransferase-like enzyme/Ser/Thr protein kinase RdoA (MazF antagonist)
MESDIMIDFDLILKEHYELDVASHTRLDGESELTERIVTKSGESFVVKVGAPGRGKTDVEVELAVLEHLEQAQLDFMVPRVRRTTDGATMRQIAASDGDRWLRVLTWVPGQSWRSVHVPDPSLLRKFGRTAASLVTALEGLDAPGLDRTHAWDMRFAPQLITAASAHVADLEQRRVLEGVAAVVEEALTRYADQLPKAIVHQDLNDFNVLVERVEGCWEICGVIDVGDTLASWRVAELAVAAGYAILQTADPLVAIGNVVAGFDEQIPLTDAELAVVVPLTVARLAMNFATWTTRWAAGENTDYAADRMKHTWPPLSALAELPKALGEAQMHIACHRKISPPLRAAKPSSPVVASRPTQRWLDLSPEGDVGETLPVSTDQCLVVAQSGEPRLSRAARRSSSNPPLTTHLGVDVFVSAGETVFAPWAGVISMATDDTLVLRSGDDAPLILRGIHGDVSDGSGVESGQALGVVTGRPCDADAPTHLHVQFGIAGHSLPPTFVTPARAAAWEAILTNPASILFGEAVPPQYENVDSIVALRQEHLASSQRSYYDRPMNLVRASGVWFTDEDSLQYLDAVNNVTHVGHGHPRVVDAATRQLRRLNTNSRFVYPQLAEYCQRLTDTMPDGLEVVFLACTGSEANDLALRIARTVTGRSDVLTIDGAYHGNTMATNAVSPNRYKGKGGSGTPPGTWEIPMPDRYRGRYGYDDPEAGLHYAQDAASVVKEMQAAGTPPAAVICESLMGTAGEIVHPQGFLQGVFESVRRAGGLCISDEVQVGFGRMGETYWGFEMHDVVPDIVTMGKPMGNGYPMSAVVTTREIANAFDTGMKYFNTFGGNPVACAVGLTVLDIIEDEDLQRRSLEVGQHFKDALNELRSRHELIGDVRGQGLYIGVELVLDRNVKTPATAVAHSVTERMKEEGIIVGPNGRYDNILKIKPPMVFGREHADLFVSTLDQILREF